MEKNPFMNPPEWLSVSDSDLTEDEGAPETTKEHMEAMRRDGNLCLSYRLVDGYWRFYIYNEDITNCGARGICRGGYKKRRFVEVAAQRYIRRYKLEILKEV